MAETAAEQQPDLAPPNSPSQKRKRGAEPASPDARRSKRGASAAALAPQIDAAATAFMEASSQAADQGLTTSNEFSVIPATSGEHNSSSSSNNSNNNNVNSGSGSGSGSSNNNNSNNHSSSSNNAGTSSDAATAAAAAASAALASSTAAAALGSMFPQLNVPPSTEETFANQQVEGEHHADASAYSADVTQGDGLSGVDVSGAHSNGVPSKRPMSGIQVKPAVGSDEWHKMRKDNHKEVERRRRETINEGINELAKIVPGCEKNKGSILQRAVVFITQLKENETQNIEKWTLEKLLTEQAIAELSASNDKLKTEVERIYRELETWKRVAQNAGLQPPEEKTEAST